MTAEGCGELMLEEGDLKKHDSLDIMYDGDVDVFGYQDLMIEDLHNQPKASPIMRSMK